MRPSSILDNNHYRHLYQTIHYYLILNYAIEFMMTIRVSASSNTDTASDHLEFAKKLLSTGKYSDALLHFHEAINQDPSNYLTYFKRATVYLALNKPKAALDDLNKAYELNKDFTSALQQRANLLVKMGQLDEAQIDFEHLLARDQNNQESLMMYEKINKLREDITNVQYLIQDYQFDVALNTLNSLVEMIPYNNELLQLRAESFEKVGEIRRAISDYKILAKLNVDANSYLKISKLCYRLGDIQESLNNVRECLKLDPDHKSCMDFYKPTKRLNNHITNMVDSKKSKDFDDCYTQGKNSLKVLTKTSPDAEKHQLPLIYSIQSVMCHCLSRNDDFEEGLKICDEAINNSQEGGIENIAIEKPDLLCDKADLLATKEEYKEAIKLYQESHKLKPSERAKSGVEKMKRIQKQKKRRDYYKILGVSRQADDSEINKAYRKLAIKWHPDRHPDEESKKKAQQKFMDIADAKAVLTDKEKRQMYDSGEDPLDPESKQHHSQHGFYGDPFSQFHGAGGSPFTFKFNFG